MCNYSTSLKVGLLGERLQIYTDHGSSKIQWSRYGSSRHQRLTWYKVGLLLARFVFANNSWFNLCNKMYSIYFNKEHILHVVHSIKY